MHANSQPGLLTALIQDKIISPEIYKNTSTAANKQGTPFFSHLIQTGIITDNDLMNCCLRHFNFPTFDLKKYSKKCLSIASIKPEVMLRYHAIPLKIIGSVLQLCMSDPTDQIAISAIEFHTGLSVHPVLVLESELNTIIETHCRSTILSSQIETTLEKISAPKESSAIDDVDEQPQEPVIQFVDSLIHEATMRKASDIHIEPFDTECRIRFRVDGLLTEITTIPLHLSLRVITRIKIIAKMNIAERRLPQDGRIQHSESLDIRVNACPTQFGEKLVLRILNRQQNMLEMSNLGLTQNQLSLLLSKLSQPQGLILVTGPTGSGKTQTLYSALHHLNKIDKNIASVEDPIEINLHGINQTPVHPRIDLTFPTLLRSLLRQDPDILMIGEIRDTETAEIALQAAQTGHLVLSTLHANSAAQTLPRLQTMGIKTDYLFDSLSLIIAQRLIRRLCSHCKKHNNTATGCPLCTQGYKGRTGIFELLSIDHTTHQMGMTLRESGLEKVKDGITSLMEIDRVLGTPPA